MNDPLDRRSESFAGRCFRQLRRGFSALASCYFSWVIFFAFLGLYAVTLMPDVLPADAGEFQRVAATAGVAHPPGYPLYTMLGWAFSHVPLGPTPAWRMNAFSALTAAATLGLVFSTARQLTDTVLGGLTAALTLGSATTYWATATKTSIRPLTAFFTALCLWALVRHASEVQRQASVVEERYLVLFSLALSLGITHHPSLVFPGAAFVLYLVLVDPSLLRQPDRWLVPLAALLPGLLVLLYLPLRGAPDLATPSGFLNHVLARGFRGDMFALGLLDRLVLLPTLLHFQFNLALLVGMGLGAWLLLWSDRRLALLLVGSFLVHTVVTLTYDAPQTVEYEMPVYVSLAVLIAMPIKHIAGLRAPISVTASQLLDRGCAGSKERRVLTMISGVVGIALLVAGCINLGVHLPSYRSLSRSRDARSYAETVLHQAPEDAVILSNWHWFTPLQYLQRVEGVRPDVIVDYVAPRGEPLAQTWVRTIQEHISERPVVVVRYFQHEYGALPYIFEPLGEAFRVRSEPRLDTPSDLNALDVVLGGQIEMRGYRLMTQEVRPARPLTVMLAWSPTEALASDIALFAQLIGPDGRLWSAAEDPQHALDTLSTGEIVIDRFLVYPQLQASPGEYTLVVGAYPVGASSGGRFTAPDGSQTVALETVRLQPSTMRPVTQHRQFVRFADGPTLMGVDYDLSVEGAVRTYLQWAGPGELTEVQLSGARGGSIAASRVPRLERGQYATVAMDTPDVPRRLTVGAEGKRRWNLFFGGSIHLPSPSPSERYIPFGDAMVLTHASRPKDVLEPGAEATLSLRFRSQRPLQRDYIVSTSLTGLKADGAWAWRASDDTVPALGAIPTLKWIRGSSVLDPHRMQVPGDASAVPVVGSLLAYDHFTQRALPNLDERLGPVVELGTWHLSD